MRTILILSLVLAALGLSLHIWPQADIAASRLFYKDGTFALAENPFNLIIHKVAVYGSRFLGIALLAGTMITFVMKKNILTLNAKAFLFLFLALVIGPGLIANVGFKDHWGRARPNSIVEFGGQKQFTPALTPSDQCTKNCSFVAGDGSFGSFLITFAFIVPLVMARRVFWLCCAAGFVLGLNRVMMGAHFLSDTLFAALLMVLTTPVIYLAFYGKNALLKRLAAICGRQNRA